VFMLERPKNHCFHNQMGKMGTVYDHSHILDKCFFTGFPWDRRINAK
jgi:hypothetical protein